MQIFDIRTVIMSLKLKGDKKLVKDAFLRKYPDLAPKTYDGKLYKEDKDFTAEEKNFLSKLFIEVNGKIVINHSDEVMILAGRMEEHHA